MKMKMKKKRKSKRGRTHNIHFRELPSKLYTEEYIDKRFIKFIQAFILPRISFKGYKLKEKQYTTIQCIFNLFVAETRKKVIADKRNLEKGCLRIQVWDALEKTGLCNKCLGSPASHKVTLYRGTGILMSIIEQYQGAYWDYNLIKNSQQETPSNHALYNIRTGKVNLETGEKIPKPQQKNPIPLKHLDPVILRQIKEMERRTEFRNQINLRHRWTYHFDNIYGGRQLEVNPCDRIVDSGQFLRYEGMHSWGLHSIQSLNEDERREILIDNEEPTAELDFSGYMIRICYNHKQIDPPHDEDIYKPQLIFPKLYNRSTTTKYNKEVVRDFVKRATNICFNTLSKQKAIQAISKLWREDKNEKKMLNQIIYKIEQLPKPQIREIVERIITIHPDIEDCFFINWLDEYTAIGSFYMTFGSFVMERILYGLALAEIPAVGIHDAIVCKREDIKEVRGKMIQIYKKLCSFKPVIKRKY